MFETHTAARATASFRTVFAWRKPAGNGSWASMDDEEDGSRMEYTELRELVRIRHELRSLAMNGEDRDTAASLLDRMRRLAAGDAAEDAAVQPEVRRWQFVFGIGVPGPDGAR
jgi:hypothetical protein